MEALILLFIVLVFGFFSFPLYSYFTLIAVYSFTFCDVGVIFWSIFIVLGAVFLIPSLRLKLISSKLVSFINKKGLKLSHDNYKPNIFLTNLLSTIHHYFKS